MRSAASAVLVESLIADCAADKCVGGGAYADDGANLTLRGGSLVERCTSTRGSAFLALRANVDVLEGSILRECHSSYIGGAMHLRLG